MEQNQELMYQLSMFEQQMQQMQKQVQSIDEAIMDLSTLNIGLDDMIGAQGKEIMAPIGRGIFAKAKLTSEDLVVDIGGRNLVKKTIPETKKIIEDQLEKLKDAKIELNKQIEETNKNLTETMMKAQKEIANMEAPVVQESEEESGLNEKECCEGRKAPLGVPLSSELGGKGKKCCKDEGNEDKECGCGHNHQ